MRARPSSVLLPPESQSPGIVQTPVVHAQTSSLHLFRVTVLPLSDIDWDLALYLLV